MKTVQHGGNANDAARRLGLDGCPDVRLDFSVNLNPIGPPPALRRVLLQGVDTATSYPDEFAAPACDALAAAHGLDPASTVVGNGSTEIFGWIVQALRPNRPAAVAPAYGGYREVCAANGLAITEPVVLEPDNSFSLSEPFTCGAGEDLLFLGSPNNPTGRLVQSDVLHQLARRNPGAVIVVDVSFIDFAGQPCPEQLRADRLPANMLVVKSLTKFFCIAGLRLGMAWGRPELIERIRSVRLPWSVNGLSQSLAQLLYADTDYMERSRARTTLLRDRFMDRLTAMPGFSPFAAAANFVLTGLPEEWPAPRLQAELLKRGILIRTCEDFTGLDTAYCRLAIRPEPEQDELIETLCRLREDSQSTGPRRPHREGEPVVSRNSAHPPTPALMVVGTTSNAGKSIVAAGFCRLLARRGFDVAPFKAQNMALNSYVTAEGGEMGRAQVTQACAAGQEPHTDMNPVLLKPLGEKVGSQVIVAGHPIGNMTACEYYAGKCEMREAAHAAYNRLAARHDVIVLEGAGSPAEINLMEEDFVNMNMADYAGARTVLVADIDRGGVFASIFGTISLIPPAYRRLIAGVIINKFRGDVSLLGSGIRDIEAMTGIPVLGVLPYMPDLRIEEEDSLGLEKRHEPRDPVLDIAVIRLPRISNFTDYLPMECDAGIRLRYVGAPDALGAPDLIILPGTKNTRADLQWLHDTGIGAAVRRANSRGTPAIGICGGLQMLGREVIDDIGIEGEAGRTPGLALLPVTTRLGPRKELAQVEGVTTDLVPFGTAGIRFRGYEIHAGITETAGDIGAPLRVTCRRGVAVDETAGFVSDDGLVFGCYVHGVFDDAGIRKSLWRWLCDRKKIARDTVTVSERSAASEFERLADLMEAHLNLAFLVPLCNAGRMAD